MNRKHVLQLVSLGLLAVSFFAITDRQSLHAMLAAIYFAIYAIDDKR